MVGSPSAPIGTPTPNEISADRSVCWPRSAVGSHFGVDPQRIKPDADALAGCSPARCVVVRSIARLCDVEDVRDGSDESRCRPRTITLRWDSHPAIFGNYPHAP